MKALVRLANYLLLLSLFWTRKADVDAAVAKNSSPFDPFRLECPFFHGIVKLDLQRVESSEGVRVDTMVTSFCENVKKLFPSPRDPTLTTADESCRWTSNFQIPKESFDFTETCNGREFVSGISRQAAGEYGILCCKIKDRKKGNCGTVDFTLPTSAQPVVEIETGKRILTGIGHENGRLTAQFCDMAIMSKKEVDEEFIANARAQLLAHGDDKVANPLTKDIDSEVTTRHSVTKSGNNRANSQSVLSPPGIRPPAGFTQPRGRPAPKRPSATDPTDEEDGSGQTQENKGNNVEVARLAVIKNAISSPSAQAGPKNGRPILTRPTGAPTTKVGLKTTESPDESSEESTAAPSKSPKKSSTTSEPVDSVEEDGAEENEKSTPAKSQTTKTSKATTSGPLSDTTPTDEPISPDPAKYQVLGIPRPAGSQVIRPKVPFVKPSPTTDQSDDPDLISTNPTSGGFKLASVRPSASRHQQSQSTIEQEEEEIASPTPLPAETEQPSETVEPEESTTKKPKKNKPVEENLSTTEKPKDKPDDEELNAAVNTEGEPTQKPDEEKQTRKPKGKETKLETGKPKSGKTEKPKTGKGSKTAGPKVIEDGVASPPVDIGNVSSISNGIVLNPHNSIESAIAPPKPLFTVLPLPPRFEAVGDKAERRFISPAPFFPPEKSASLSAGVTTSTISTTTAVSRLECHTNTAFRDPQSNLVVACGQGDDIWVPSRCQPGMLCLLGKDSSYRLCCSVRI